MQLTSNHVARIWCYLPISFISSIILPTVSTEVPHATLLSLAGYEDRLSIPFSVSIFCICICIYGVCTQVVGDLGSVYVHNVPSLLLYYLDISFHWIPRLR